MSLWISCFYRCIWYSPMQKAGEHAARIIRGHWGIGNKLHWVLDVTFKEDASRIRRGQGAEVMNAMRKIALNLLKQNITRQASMKRRRKMTALDDTFRAELLLGANL